MLMKAFIVSKTLRRHAKIASLVMVAVVFVYYLTKCCARDTGLLDTPSGTPTITNADGTVSNGDECYPQYPGFDSVLVGYGNTRIGSCNGPACTLNDGRKPIKVAPDRNSRYCRNVTACVTMTVKTRGRLQNVKRLIESARYLYPHIKVIIADELEPNATDSDYRSVDLPPSGVVYFKTTPGVGFGRRVALSLVVTKYALVMDDDFVFTSQTNLAKLVDLLERSSADIVGGAVIDYVLYAGITRVVDSCESAGTCYASQYNYPGAFYERVPLFGSCFVTDRVKNFFLADRQAVLAAGSWDESRPFYEHEDFFVQMRRSGVTVALCLDVKVIHRWRNHSRLAFIRGQYDRIMAQQFLLKWKLAAVYECRPQLYLAQNCYVPGSKPTSTPLDRNTAAALNQSRLAPICER